MGRPAKKQLKTKIIGARVTEKDWKKFRKQCKANNTSMARTLESLVKTAISG